MSGRSASLPAKRLASSAAVAAAAAAGDDAHEAVVKKAKLGAAAAAAATDDAVANKSKLLLSIGELQRVTQFCWDHIRDADCPSADALHKAAAPVFLPDVSAYEGKIYVKLYIDLRGGQVHAGFVTTPRVWSLIQQGTGDEDFNLGEVAGKHSEVKVGYVESYWSPQVFKDPYAIAKMVGLNGDYMPDWIEQYLEENEYECADDLNERYLEEQAEKNPDV